MSEQTNDPPLVQRVEPPEPEAPPAPSRPRPGFWEAILWCIIFLAGQLFGAVVGGFVVFTIYTLQAPNPQAFASEQLDAFTKSVDPKATGARPPVPVELGNALAWGMLTAQLFSLALIALVLPRRIGPDWKRQIGVRRPHWLHVVLVLLIVPGFMIGADVIQTLFLSLTGMKPPPAMKALNSIFGRFPWPLTALAVAIGPGVVEELWCRGFLGRGLSARYGLIAGVLLTSAFFALMHIDPTQLLVIACMGAYLHFIYLATRSIWVPILLHASNNGLAIVLALTVSQEAMDRPMPIVVPLGALSLLLFGSVALWTNRAKLEPLLRQDEAWYESDGWAPEYPGISAPPPEATVQIGYADISPAAVLFTIVSFLVVMYMGYLFLI